jgi:phenylalanyl-tRNA synthetase alpha chain
MDTLMQRTDEALAAIAAAATLDALEAHRVALLGKNGVVTAELKALGKLSPDARKARGAQVNVAKEKIADAIAARKKTLERAVLEQRLASEGIDITQPGRDGGRGTIHPLTRTRERIEAVFAQLGYSVAYLGAIVMALLAMAGFVHAFVTPRNKGFAVPNTVDDIERLAKV